MLAWQLFMSHLVKAVPADIMTDTFILLHVCTCRVLEVLEVEGRISSPDEKRQLLYGVKSVQFCAPITQPSGPCGSSMKSRKAVVIQKSDL